MLSRRHERVRALLLRAVGEIIRREIAFHEHGLVTVNDIGLAGDLHAATVFVSILGPSAAQQKGLALLRQSSPRIQQLLGREVILKYTPRLRFQLDDSIARGNRVLTILDEIERTGPAE